MLALAAPASAGTLDLAARQGLSSAQIGTLLFDPATGAALEAHNADALFTPASVAKLATVTAALRLLGPEHRFTTAVLATGPLRGEVVQGDLILRGGGDPTLASEDLIALAEALAAKGVRRITGRFRFDTGALPELPRIDRTQPVTEVYNSGVGALSLNFNRFELSWRRGPDGRVTADAMSVADAGRHPADSIAIEIAATGPRPLTQLSPPEGERWRLVPGPKAPARIMLPVTRPGRTAAAVFRQVAAGAGITLPDAEPGATPVRAVPLAAHDSAPLAELSRGLLRWSNNLSAELIGLSASRRIDAAAPTLERSAAALTGWLTQAAPGTDWGGFRLLNHSGLEAESRVTPRHIAAVLRLGGPGLAALLPGEDGGVRAKSGTMAYASGLAGYLTAASGRELGFVLFTGDPAQRRAFDAALDRYATEMPPPARAWLGRARAFRNDLLKEWTVRY